jgi:hypothetical protein
MKYLLSLLTLSLISTTLLAQESDWEFDKLSFYAENDTLFDHDEKYTAGEAIEILYHLKNTNNFISNNLSYGFEESTSYVSFSLGTQAYTPDDTDADEIVEDEQPYAGWTYLESTLYSVSKTQLRSLSLKVGMVGPASGAEHIQNGFHNLFGIDEVDGWNNQLENEVGVNLKYTQKWRIDVENDIIETAFIPFVSTELGNIATNASAGFSTRIGWNIPKDFGAATMNMFSDAGINSYSQRDNATYHDWSFSLNFMAAGSGIARDIFLDGNTNKDSHSVDRKKFVGYLGYGFSLRYKDYIVDLVNIYNTKKYNSANSGHNYTSLRLSMLF